jgi:type I phosphodiesterase/nucleotide pyrophosphatase
MRPTVAAALLAAVSPVVSAQAPASRGGRPALVVFIAVDQLRGDYLDRFSSQLTGGLARFRNNSAFFPHAWQDHAITETAPGHSTMLSGREPVHTEIISNNRGVPDELSPLIGSRGTGASPRRFVGTTLYDWLRARDSGVRVLSVSRKDRGAILTVGRARGDVYWFADGRFTTSRYYADTLPSWVTAFDDSLHLERLAGHKWDLLLPPDQYPEPDSVWVENSGSDFVFPHVLPPVEQLRAKLQSYPQMDSVTLAFALEGVRRTGIGKRALSSSSSRTMPDLLAISLSTTDAVGHAFGPDSREVHDQVLRVDRWLGDFMRALEREIPSARIVYALTGDHGVAPLPELEVPRTGHGGRIWIGDIAAAAEQALEARYGADFGIDFDNGLMFGDVAALRARGLNTDSLAAAMVAEGTKRVGVRIGFTAATLTTSSDSAAVRWRRTLPASLSYLAVFTPSSGFLWSPGKSTAEHGTPNAMSLSVPISFIGEAIPVGRHERLVRTVDIAPTLAALIGVKPTERLDGSAIGEVVGRPAKAIGQR